MTIIVSNPPGFDYPVKGDTLPAGAGEVQWIRIAADAAEAKVPATVANGLLVDVSRIQGSVTVTGSVTTTIVPGQINLLAGAHVAVNTSADQLFAANTDATERIIENLSDDTDIYVGPTGVTTTNGKRIRPGGEAVINCTNALFAVTAAGSADVFVMELERP